jgi:hypothetical protein
MEERKTAGPEAPGCFVCMNMLPFMRNIWSEATRDHFRNSRVEFLKGIRSILDSRIERLSHEERRGTTVPVE